MYLVYTGQKKELKLTMPELKKKYHFKGDKPVKVEASDGGYLMKEFGQSFKLVDAPPENEQKKPTKAEIKAQKKAEAEAQENDTLSDMGADGPAPEK